MAALSGTVLFYTVLIAPGFIAVMTAISLAAVEDRPSRFILLVACLVSSLLIDTLAVAAYQAVVGPVTGTDQVADVFFSPGFQWEYVLTLVVVSLLLGVIYAGLINAGVPDMARAALQSGDHVTYNPRQPWTNTLHDASRIRIKSSDDQLFIGDLVEWSRADRPKQLRIANPWRYNEQIDAFEQMSTEEDKGPEMLFLEDDIDRVFILESDEE